MDKVICVHMVTTGHMKEAMLFRDIAAGYGAEVKYSYGKEIPNITDDFAVFGVPKGLHNMASTRPFYDEENFNRKLSRCSYMAKEDTGEYKRSESACIESIHIACRFMLDIGFDDYDHPPFQEVKTLDEMLDDWEPSGDTIVWYDYETTSLDPFTGDVISCAVWFENDDSIDFCWPVYFLYGTELCAEFIVWLVEGQFKSGACNAKFEQKWNLKYAGGTSNVVQDTQVDWALLYEEDAKDLDTQAMVVGWHGYSLPMTEFLTPMNKHRAVNKKDRNRHHEAPKELLMDYNCKDTYVTGLVGMKTRQLLRKEKGRMVEVADWMIRGQAMLARMEMNGMVIDKKFLMLETVEIQNRMHNLMEYIQETASEYDMEDFNMNSPPQKKELLYTHLGLPIFKLTNGRFIHKTKYKEGWWKAIKSAKPLSPSTDAEAMGMMLDYLGEHKLLDAMNEYTTLSTIKGTFITNFEAAIAEGDGKMRSNFSLTKLVTGQMSSTNPPMQNIPKGTIRRAFKSRFKSGRIMEIDFSQLHLRIIGNLAQCGGFEEAYGGGVDLHSRTAAKVIAEVSEKSYLKRLKEGDKHAKDDRQTAKRTNFSIIFEIGAKALAIKTGRTEEECKRIISNWFEEYPEIAEQIERQHDYAEQNGYVISPFGRVRHLPNAQSPDKWLRLRALRQAGDFLVSNSGRYMTMYGMILLDDAIIEADKKSVLVLQVHDSIVVDMHPDEVDWMLDTIQDCMISQITDMCYEWMDPIQLEMDGFAGPNWHVDDADMFVEMTTEEITVETKDAC